MQHRIASPSEEFLRYTFSAVVERRPLKSRGVLDLNEDITVASGRYQRPAERTNRKRISLPPKPYLVDHSGESGE